MSNMQAEVFHAFRSIGIEEEAAAKAAAALNEPDKNIASLKSDVSHLQSDVSVLKSDVSLLKWMVGTNVTLTLLVLGKLFLIPG